MSKDELTDKLKAIYWAGQDEKERAVRHYSAESEARGAGQDKARQLIQRSVEDIEHGMRLKLAHVAIEWIHSNIE